MLKRLINVISLIIGFFSLLTIYNAITQKYDGASGDAVLMVVFGEGFILAANYILFRAVTLWNSGDAQ